jgi:hypothetical protein
MKRGNMHKYIVKIIFMVLVFLSGCTQSFPGGENLGEKINKEEEFAKIYSDVNMNQAIILNNETRESEREKGIVSIGITNQTADRICFPVDNNIGVLFFDQEINKWRELVNNAEYFALNEEIVLEPSGTMFDYSSTSAKPVINIDHKTISEYRIVIWGKICNEAISEKKEGAYIDIAVE